MDVPGLEKRVEGRIDRIDLDGDRLWRNGGDGRFATWSFDQTGFGVALAVRVR